MTVIARCNNVLCFDLDQRRQPSVSIFGDFLPSNESADSTAEVVHIDASLIRANVSWDSLVERHVEDVLSENQSEKEIEGDKKGGRAASTRRSARLIPTRRWPRMLATDGWSPLTSGTPPYNQVSVGSLKHNALRRQLDDRMLADIGISKSQAIEEASKPFLEIMLINGDGTRGVLVWIMDGVEGRPALHSTDVRIYPNIRHRSARF